MHILLSTEHLYLKKITEADFDVIAELDADPDVVRYIRPVLDRKASHELSQKRVAYYDVDARLGYWLFCDKQTHAVLGDGVMRYFEDKGDIEVGYRFRTSEWGKGYATEICRALIAHVATEFKPPRIVAVITPENHASQRVVIKCGMKQIERYTRNDEELLLFCM